MRNGITLEIIKKEVRIEAGLSTDAGHTVFNAEKLNQMINRTERLMAIEDDWPSQTFEEQVAVLADAQYVNLPANINFTMIDTAHVSYGSEWLPITHGIGARERSVYNSTQRAAPIQRWEIQAPGNVNFEVWPIGSAAQTLLFEGAKSLGGMLTESSVCILDADVIVLRVAAEILGRDRKDDAELKMALARRLAAKIIKRQGSSKRSNINLANTQGARRLRAGIDYIAPGA